MATLHFNTIQHSIFLLSFLLQLSLGYEQQTQYFISCGSNNDVTLNNNVYIGESNSNYPKTSFSNSNIVSTDQSSKPSPLYQTARIFQTNSSYHFSTNQNNTYMVRLHFYSFSSQTTNLSTAKFSVSVPCFSTLLQNFDAKNTTNNPLIKEYFVRINQTRFIITFIPQQSSFAFVNAIELFMLPIHLISDEISRFTYNKPIGQIQLSPYSGGFHSRALETKHRINVGGESVNRENDNLSREWLSDDSYITNPQNAVNGTPFGGNIKFANDETDGPNSNQYIAPEFVYKTAKKSKNGNLGLNISWSFPIEKNIDHLLRLHFCDIFNDRQGQLTTFLLFIYDSFVIFVNNDTNVTTQLQAPYYYDFVVQSDDSGLLKIRIDPNTADFVPNAFLNGVEIMKVIESSGSFQLDDLDLNPGSNKVSILVVVGSIVGGLFFISLVVVAFIWISKIRKQNIPAVAREISHSRLTYGKTTQGSSLANINLGLKISFLNLQLATNNFDEKRIIGKGGFGNVYKGVLKNGMSVAVKRSVSGSSQGLHEFQTEIMVLSKIRHIHLVSLIGYCDEMYEMILVYEYMEKGTLRDNLYNSNLPCLNWKQRLEICISAAKGLHYLHKEVAGGIIHRDVKSTNILLDDNLVAKVADFGLSRPGPLDQHSYVSTCVKGTFGYLDPDYFRSQALTEKSDVYSFGVVLLEVLCSRPAIEQDCPSEQVNLAEWGLLCKYQGILEEIIDPSIKGQINQSSLRIFSEIVEKCLQDDGCDRPTMENVLWDLEYALQLQREPHEDSSSSALVSLQLPNVQCLPSLSTLIEVHGKSIGKVDESESTTSMMLDRISCEANQGTTINSQVSPLEELFF